MSQHLTDEQRVSLIWTAFKKTLVKILGPARAAEFLDHAVATMKLEAAIAPAIGENVVALRR